MNISRRFMVFFLFVSVIAYLAMQIILLYDINSQLFYEVERHHKHHHKGDDDNITSCDTILPKYIWQQFLDSSLAVIAVDQHGCGNFSTVQAAVNAVPDNNPNRTVIFITTGIYEEKVMVPKSKSAVTFQGQGYQSTIIVWNDTANSSGGTFYSATLSVYAADFVAKDLSIKNSAPIANPGDVGGQAVAMRIAGDRAAFYDCGFYSGQDTLHDDRGRHYYKNCFIQGSIDFIFGDAKSLFEECTLSSIANAVPMGSNIITGAITAQARTSLTDDTGFSFVRCNIGGTGNVWLGRAWRPYSRVVFAYTYMSDIISEEGWNNWNDPTRDSTIFYGQYKCWGPGANQVKRVAYSKELNQTEACPFLDISFVNGDEWLFTSPPPYLNSFKLPYSHTRINFEG